MPAGLLASPVPRHTSGRVTPRRRCTAYAIVFISAVTLFNLLYVAVLCPLDLSPDEAHYWDWSRHLDWSYYSKGPLVAWLIRGSCELFGQTPFAVRFPAVVCGGLLLTGMWRLAANTSRDERFGFVVVLLAVTLPPFSAASVLMTIDPPFMACWAWAAVAVQKKRWLGAGGLVAVGTLAKYTMLLFPAGVGLLMLARPEWRTRRYLPFLTVSAAGLVPVVVWNATHDWVGVRHLLGHAENGGQPAAWSSPFAFVAGQFGLLLGVWFVLWAVAAWQWRPTVLFSTSPRWGEVVNSAGVGGRGVEPITPLPARLRLADLPPAGGGEEGRTPGSNTALLWWLSVPVFVAFLIASVRTSGQPNWPAAAYVSGFVLAAGWLLQTLTPGPSPTDTRLTSGWGEGSKRAFSPPLLRFRAAGTVRGRGGWGVRALIATTLLGLALTGALRWPNLVRPALAAVLPAPTDHAPTPIRKLDPTARLVGWRTLASAVDQVRLEEKRRTGEEPLLAAMAWTVPGELGFYCDGRPTVYSFGAAVGDRASQYDLWQPNPVADAQAFAGRTFVYVGDELPDGVFDRVELARRVTHTECGVPLATWKVWVCAGYRGFDRNPRPTPNRY